MTTSTVLTKLEKMKSWMSDELLGEILSGARVIGTHFPHNDKGFLLLVREKPVTDPKDGRLFFYAYYEKPADMERFYLASEFVKVRVDHAKKMAYKKWYD